METDHGQQLLRALHQPEPQDAKTADPPAPAPAPAPARARPARARRSTAAEAEEVSEAMTPRLSLGECEELDATLRSQRKASMEMEGALDAFRKERRRQATEDPLELLEWKLPKDDAATRPIRAVLEIKRSKKESAVAQVAETQAAEPEGSENRSRLLADYDDSGSEDADGKKLHTS